MFGVVLAATSLAVAPPGPLGPAGPSGELARLSPDQVDAIREAAESRDLPEEPIAADPVANVLVSAWPSRLCRVGRPSLAGARLFWLEGNLDDDEHQEAVVVVGPVCKRSRKSVITVIDRDEVGLFVRAVHSEVYRLSPHDFGIDAGTLQATRAVRGPSWSEGTWQPVRLRLGTRGLRTVPPPRFRARALPAALQALVAAPTLPEADASTLERGLIRLVGDDVGCEWTEERPSGSTVRLQRAELDGDPDEEIVVYAPQSCQAPQAGLGLLVLVDPTPAGATVRDVLADAFVGEVFHVHAPSKTVWIENTTIWGSHVQRTELEGWRVDKTRWQPYVSIPCRLSDVETEVYDQRLSCSMTLDEQGFEIAYRGSFLVANAVELDPRFAGTALDDPDGVRILDLRARVQYRWDPARRTFDRYSLEGTTPRQLELFTAHGWPAFEDAPPWMGAFDRQFRRTARRRPATKLFHDWLAEQPPRP